MSTQTYDKRLMGHKSALTAAQVDQTDVGWAEQSEPRPTARDRTPEHLSARD
ncbi:hypothetical protein [Dyella tabacisoli]|uniref:hypothetical protein n=1 Tax=Dyella tabacisoli TaxID=2282381 RepID=UPI0013B359C2|nr:hypothetical protein [Dyella tabacisoli]